MASGSPDWQPKIITSGSDQEQKKVDVTDADSTATFSQVCLAILIYNDGPNVIHYNKDAAANTDHFPIPSKSWFMIDVPTSVIHLICAAGKTATVYCIGVF